MIRKISLISAVLIPSMIFALAILVAAGVLPYRASVVQTGSMSPTYPAETMLFVKLGDMHLGQAITFKKGTETVTHRWIATNADGTLETKGDANSSPDPTGVKPTDVIGEVIGAVPRLGFWYIYVSNPYSIASILFGGLAVWLSVSLLREDESEVASTDLLSLSTQTGES